MKNNFKKLVCIQGLGYVGSAMCACVASAHDTGGNNYFDVVGLWHTKSSYYRQKCVIKNQSGCSRHHGGPSFFAI